VNTVQQQQQAGETTTLVERAVGAAIAHSEKWGTVWFGLVFLGSLLAALGRAMWPQASPLWVTVASLVIGLLAGIVAHVRGAWL
jgi:hypothetical protein